MKKPIKLITLDTETYNGLIGGLKRIAIYDGQDVTYGYTFSEIDYQLRNLSEEYEVHVYIHNLEFDIKKLVGFFDSGLIDWNKSIIINGKIAVIKHMYYTLHDSFKILPLSLAALSGKKGFNVEHAKVDLKSAIAETYPGQYLHNGEVNIVKFLNDCPIDDPLFLEYLGYDVISLYEILMKLIEVSGIPIEDFVKRVSTASISRYIFKKGYKGKTFQCEGKSAYDTMCSFNYNYEPDYEDMIRAGYCGGRTEVFKMYMSAPGFHYDINSLYPYVMMMKPYPVGKPYYFQGLRAENKFKSWQSSKIGLGFITVSVYIPECNVPPLPAKMGKLCFPCGYIYGVFTFDELQNAIEHYGVKIIEVNEVLYYPKTAFIFKEFIETFSELKIEAEKSGNMALRYFSKLVMNTGYGYTGMKREKSQLKNWDYVEKDTDVLIYKNKELGYKEYEKILKSDYIQPQVAAYVTSYARMVILEGLKYADEQGDLYYCDTDSVVCSTPLPDSIVDKYELGKFKLESQPQNAIFLKPKVYIENIEGTCEPKFKGISRDFQKDLTYQDYAFLFEHLKYKDVEAVFIERDKIQFPSVMTALKNGKDPNEFRLQDKVFNIITQDKRSMNYLENSTKPLFFKSEDEYTNFNFFQGAHHVNIKKLTEQNLIPDLPNKGGN